MITPPSPSPQIIAAIKNWEGLRLSPYRCPAGKLTIGYGHTGSDITPNLTINAAQAEALLLADLNRLADELYRWLRVDNTPLPLRQHQFDALLSFAYNLGMARLRSSTLWRHLTSNPYHPAIPAEFRRWVYASTPNGGRRILPGLQSRRAAEAAIYHSAIYPTA